MFPVFVFSLVVLLFENVFTENHKNETAQIESGNDFVNSSSAIARNFTANNTLFNRDLDVQFSDLHQVKENVSKVIELRVKETNNNTSNSNTSLLPSSSPAPLTTKQTNKLDNFRPSPQLDTHHLYEFNRFPVKAAFPEPKLIPTLIKADDENHQVEGRKLIGTVETVPLLLSSSENDLKSVGTMESRYQVVEDTNNNEESNKYYDNNNNGNGCNTCTNNGKGQLYVGRIKFPSNSEPNQNSYAFSPTNQYVNFPANHQQQQYQVPASANGYNSFQFFSGGADNPAPTTAEGQTLRYNSHSGFVSNAGSISSDSRRNFPKLSPHIPKKYQAIDSSKNFPQSKTYDTFYNLMERPPPSPSPPSSHYYHYKSYNNDDSNNDSHDMTVHGNPWKKILKLLATFVPIGLLISALAPTVINVTNVNDTASRFGTMDTRYRLSNDRSLIDSKNDLKHRMSSPSLNNFEELNGNGCEFKVFCELLVSASVMSNAEQHVNNLLENFAKTDKNYKNHKDELKKVFKAVRKRDCKSIICN